MGTATYSFVLHESRCTNNCVFCSSREFGDIGANIEREKAKIQQLLDAGHEMAVIEISGNDPIEYPELISVVEWLRSTSPTSRLVLVTHGRQLRPTVQGLVKAGVSQFIVPLYGHLPAIHDAVTRTPGSFEETMGSLAFMADRGVPFYVTTLITPQNLAKLSELFSFLASLVRGFSVGVPLFSPQRDVVFAVDFAELRPILEQALAEISRVKVVRVRLRNIPRCALSNSYNAEFETSRPPRFGYEHRRHVASPIRLLGTKFGVLPDYQSLVKGDECAACIYDHDCAGFYESYVAKGLFEFRCVSHSTL
jgi:MoaA/NifB/PqqE/SkfB family radical SAM enzyme